MADDAIDRLLAEAGPAIRYRTYADLLSDRSGAPAKQAEEALLRCGVVRELLANLEAFHPSPTAPFTIAEFNAIHSLRRASLESSAGKLLELGLHRGIPAFDTQMTRLRGYVLNPLVERALDTPGKECPWKLDAAFSRP